MSTDNEKKPVHISCAEILIGNKMLSINFEFKVDTFIVFVAIPKFNDKN